MDSSKVRKNSQSEVFTSKSNQSGKGKSKNTENSQSTERSNRGLKSKSQPAVNVGRSEGSDKSANGHTVSGNVDTDEPGSSRTQTQGDSQGTYQTTSDTHTAVQSNMEKSNSQHSQGSKVMFCLLTCVKFYLFLCPGIRSMRGI